MKDLPKVVSKKAKRAGRGYGSGRGGHTVGRGTKGQKARNKIHVLFEGTKVKKSLLRRLPLRRGKGKFRAQPKPLIVKLEALNLLRSGTAVDLQTLADAGIVNKVDGQKYGIKILGGGKLEKKLKIKVPISASAAKLVKKAGGSVAQ
jgi:large subunit ribosomal protein L15